MLGIIKEIKHDLENLKNRLEGLKKPVFFPPEQARNLGTVRSMWSSGMRYEATKVKTENKAEKTK